MGGCKAGALGERGGNCEINMPSSHQAGWLWGSFMHGRSTLWGVWLGAAGCGLRTGGRRWGKEEWRLRWPRKGRGHFRCRGGPNGGQCRSRGHNRSRSRRNGCQCRSRGHFRGWRGRNGGQRRSRGHFRSRGWGGSSCCLGSNEQGRCCRFSGRGCHGSSRPRGSGSGQYRDGYRLGLRRWRRGHLVGARRAEEADQPLVLLHVHIAQSTGFKCSHACAGLHKATIMAKMIKACQ